MPSVYHATWNELARRKARLKRMVCRRQKSWSTATFMDAVLSSFINPFGPLLLLYFLHQSSTGDSNKGEDEANRTAVTQATLQWMTAARLWSQAFAGFLVGRTAGRLGPQVASSSSKAMPTAVVALAFLLSLTTQLWLGWGPGTLDAKAAASQLFWARCLGGFFSGLLCSGMLSLSGPCPPSSSCERCDALPRRRNVSEIRFTDSFDPVAGGGATMTTALRRADRWWQAGFVSGPLIGGLLYGRALGWPWLGGANGEDDGSSPAFAACAGACLFVLIVAAWRSPGFLEIMRALVRFCIDIRGAVDGTASRGRRRVGPGRGMRRGRGARRHQRRISGAEYSSLADVQEEGEEVAEEDGEGEETPLMIEDASTHSLGLASTGPTDRRIAGGEDIEAGLGRAETATTVDDSVPARYIEASGGDVATAREMWQATVRWREETGVEDSLPEPRPNLGIIRDCYPYYAHGRSKEGELVVYELAGRMRFDRLARAGVTPFDMQVHWAFFHDFVFGKLLLLPPPSEESRVMTVLDVGGLRLSTMMSGSNNAITAMKYLGAMSDVMQKHYPGRQGRMLVVNAPWWFGGVLSTAMSTVVSRGSRKKPRVVGANFLPALLEYMESSQIPPEYGGSSPHPLGSSPEEDTLKNMLANAASPEPRPPSPPPTPPQVENSQPLRAAGSNSGSGSSISELAGAVDALSRRPQSGEVGARVGGAPVSADTGGESLREEPGTIARSSSRQSLRDSASAASPVVTPTPDYGVGGSKGGDEDEGVGVGVGVGMTQRLASAVRRSIRGSATRAYLGVENKFRYDTARRMWIMDGNSRGGSRRGSRGTEGDEVQQDNSENACEGDEVNGSESSLVRAIQAAQQVRGGLPVPPTLNARSYATRDVAPRPWGMDGQPRGSHRGLGVGISSAAAVILALQMAWSALDSALEVFLPLWILGPAGGGGLGFSAIGAGFVVSIATAAVVIPGHLATAALLRATARSPVRALRLATVVQVVATILLSGVAGYSWLPLPENRGASFAAAIFAYAVVRGSNVVARPSLNNLLGVAIGNSSTFGSGGGGGARGKRRRTALKLVAVGVSQAIGVLVAGVVFAGSVRARAGATVLCFRLAAVAFVGVYLATLFVDATEGTGGFDAGWRGAGGAWLPACDLVEEAMTPVSAGVRSMGGFGGMSTSTARRWGSSGSMAKES